jgi:hypothetical protein
LFLLSEQGAVPLVSRNDPSQACEGCFFRPRPEYNVLSFEFGDFHLAQDGSFAFPAFLCCGADSQGLFTGQLAPLAVPNSGFEQTGENDLPQGWTTIWTNSGVGEVGTYNGGDDVFKGSRALRLHVSDGSVFVLSDPIPAAPNTVYAFSAQLRFNLAAGDTAYLTAIDFDGSGNSLGFKEIQFQTGDNHWEWQSHTLLIPTHPETKSVRIRIGLLSKGESYLDVDDVR